MAERDSFIQSMNIHLGAPRTLLGAGRKVVVVPTELTEQPERERALNRGRQCPCDTHHMARRMLWNPDERGPWPATGQGRQEGAIRSTFFKIKVSHKVR